MKFYGEQAKRCRFEDRTLSEEYERPEKDNTEMSGYLPPLRGDEECRNVSVYRAFDKSCFLYFYK